VKEIFVYLEGPSDQIGMRRLLSRPVEHALIKGNRVEFYFLGGKEPLLNNGPKKAINILRNKPNSWVFLVPDLYPPNKPFAHSSYEELKSELANGPICGSLLQVRPGSSSIGIRQSSHEKVGRKKIFAEMDKPR
jgi:hypothetical protein